MSATVAIRLARLIQGIGLKKESCIVDIVEDEKPCSILFIAQPVVNRLEYVDLRILSPCNFEIVGNISIALLETVCVARMNP